VTLAFLDGNLSGEQWALKIESCLKQLIWLQVIFNLAREPVKRSAKKRSHKMSFWYLLRHWAKDTQAIYLIARSKNI